MVMTSLWRSVIGSLGTSRLSLSRVPFELLRRRRHRGRVTAEQLRLGGARRTPDPPAARRSRGPPCGALCGSDTRSRGGRRSSSRTSCSGPCSAARREGASCVSRPGRSAFRAASGASRVEALCDPKSRCMRTVSSLRQTLRTRNEVLTSRPHVGGSSGSPSSPPSPRAEDMM